MEIRIRDLPAESGMLLAANLQRGKLIRRYKRFLADVQLSDGEIIVVHCPNPGSMIGCAEPGSAVWLRKSDNASRRLPYTWVVTGWQNELIGVDTLLANRLVKEALANKVIPALSSYDCVSCEYRLGDSRFDFCLFTDDTRKPPACLMEVKSTTLAYGSRAMFPDAKTARGLKHLQGLINSLSMGYRAIQFYCIARNDVTTFSPAKHIDPQYSEALSQAVAAGVEVMAWTTSIISHDETFSASLLRQIPVILDDDFRPD